MSSQGVLSSKKANNVPGFCPIEGQKSSPGTWKGVLKLILEPVSEYYQDLATLPIAG
jgi:hypothetical protein